MSEGNIVLALKFFMQFVTEPANIGAISASGRELAEVVTEKADVRHASTVVEFGPGTGAITRVIMEHLSPQAKFLAIELNPEFVEILNAEFPHVRVIQDSAVNVRQHLSVVGAKSCDCIVSGLPFASFDSTLQDSILEASLDALKPRGKFVTFSYIQAPFLPSGKRIRKKLYERFSKVELTPIVWKNLPPAFAYCAEK